MGNNNHDNKYMFQTKRTSVITRPLLFESTCLV